MKKSGKSKDIFRIAFMLLIVLGIVLFLNAGLASAGKIVQGSEDCTGRLKSMAGLDREIKPGWIVGNGFTNDFAGLGLAELNAKLNPGKVEGKDAVMLITSNTPLKVTVSINFESTDIVNKEFNTGAIDENGDQIWKKCTFQPLVINLVGTSIKKEVSLLSSDCKGSGTTIVCEAVLEGLPAGSSFLTLASFGGQTIGDDPVRHPPIAVAKNVVYGVGWNGEVDLGKLRGDFLRIADSNNFNTNAANSAKYVKVKFSLSESEGNLRNIFEAGVIKGFQGGNSFPLFYAPSSFSSQAQNMYPNVPIGINDAGETTSWLWRANEAYANTMYKSFITTVTLGVTAITGFGGSTFSFVNYLKNLAASSTEVSGAPAGAVPAGAKVVTGETADQFLRDLNLQGDLIQEKGEIENKLFPSRQKRLSISTKINDLIQERVAGGGSVYSREQLATIQNVRTMDDMELKAFLGEEKYIEYSKLKTELNNLVEGTKDLRTQEAANKRSLNDVERRINQVSKNAAEASTDATVEIKKVPIVTKSGSKVFVEVVKKTAVAGERVLNTIGKVAILVEAGATAVGALSGSLESTSSLIRIPFTDYTF